MGKLYVPLFRAALICTVALLADFFTSQLQAQTYNDGPIQLQVRLREIQVTQPSNSDFSLQIGSLPLGPYTDDEYSFKLFARDNADVDGVNWGPLGGTCHQATFANVPNITNDFNDLIYNVTYAGANVPQFFDINIDAWEDDIPTDFTPVSGLTPCGTNGSRCDFDGNLCCINIFGCLFSEQDDLRCNPTAFATNLDYRAVGPPCQWSDHGFIIGACGTNVYRPHIESFWRYTRGTACNNAIQLGNFQPGMSTVTHFNSNECYSNNWGGPATGNDVFYEINVTQPIGLQMELCGTSTQFNTVLYLLDASCNQIVFNDDFCGTQSRINYAFCTPGVYKIVVDGQTAAEMGTFTLTINEDPSLTPTANAGLNQSVCSGQSIQIGGSPSATGGQGPYTYNWTPATNISNPTDPNPFVFPTTNTQYILLVTDALGCQDRDTIDITVLPGPVVNLGADQDLCPGATTSLDAGPGFLSYLWNTGANSQTINVTTPGQYVAIVTDFNGCQGRDTVIVNGLPDPSPNLGADTSFCVGGSVLLDAGAGLSSYNWSTGATSASINVSTPGTYSVSVVDANGCPGADTIVIGVNPLPVVSLPADTTVCPGEIAAFDPGSGYIGYNWSTGSTNQSISVSAPAVYTVTVTDANGCQNTASRNLFNFVPPSPNIGGGSALCSSSNLTLNAGAGYVSYDWNTGATTPSISVSFPGVYSVTVTDANGCTGTDLVNVTLNAPPTVSIGNDTTICSGTTLNLDAGNPGASYIWNTFATTQSISIGTGGTYTVTVTDANGCTGVDQIQIGIQQTPSINLGQDTTICADGSVTINPGPGYSSYSWSNGSSNQTITVNQSGLYTVTVSTPLGCMDIDDRQVTVLPSPSVNLGPDVSFCTGESINLDAGPGFASYQWLNGATTQFLNTAFPGTYVVTVSDGNGCTDQDTINVSLDPLPTVNLGPDTNICPNNTLTLDAGAGQSGYNWNTGNTTQTLPVTGPGNYSVTVTDANGCRNDDAVTVDLNQPPLVTLGGDSLIVCDSGMVMLDAGAGLTAYQWSDGSVNQYLIVTQPGVYTVTVTDQYGCTGEGDIEVLWNALRPGSFLGTDTTICEGDDVLLDAGEQWVYYEWDNGNLDQYLLVSTTGTYSVVVEDPNGCRFEDEVSVTVETPPVLELGPNYNLCPGEVITLDAGPGFDSYLWSTGATTSSIEVNAMGDYSVTVTFRNCEDEDILNIGDDCPGRLFIPNVFTPNEDGVNDLFELVGVNVEDFYIKIFDRWGKFLFESTDINSFWNGTYNSNSLPEGVYFYHVDVKFSDREPIEQIDGTVTILR